MLNINFTRTFAKSILFFAAVSAQAQGLLWHQLAPGTYQVPGTISSFVLSSFSCIDGADLTVNSAAPDFGPIPTQVGMIIGNLVKNQDYDGLYRGWYVAQSPITNAGFVVNAYQCILFRDADPVSYINSLAALAAGMTRLQFVNAILASDEYKDRVKPQLLLLH